MIAVGVGLAVPAPALAEPKAPDGPPAENVSDWVPPTSPPTPLSERVADEDDLQLYGGIALTGIWAGLLVIAGVAASRVDDLQNDEGYDAYRLGTYGTDACDSARAGVIVRGAASPRRVVDICDEATDWENAQYVAIPGGVVAIAIGLYLTLSSDTAQSKPDVAVMPSFDSRGGTVTVSGRF